MNADRRTELFTSATKGIQFTNPMRYFIPPPKRQGPGLTVGAGSCNHYANERQPPSNWMLWAVVAALLAAILSGCGHVLCPEGPNALQAPVVVIAIDKGCLPCPDSRTVYPTVTVLDGRGCYYTGQSGWARAIAASRQVGDTLR